MVWQAAAWVLLACCAYIVLLPIAAALDDVRGILPAAVALGVLLVGLLQQLGV